MKLKKLNKYEIGELLIPEKIFNFQFKEKLQKVYEKIYFDNINYLIFTNLFFLSILISMVLYIFIFPQLSIMFNTYMQSVVWKLIIVFSTYFITNLIIYYFCIFFLFFKYDSKFSKSELEIEKDLPEFLDNLVSNLKGGVSLEKAFLRSVRKEQKALLTEVTFINERIMMGQNVQEALDGFRKRFTSPIISRTFFLISEGIRGGGNLAEPLEKISTNLKNIYTLNEEMRANSGGFSVVIRFISLGIAPLLFALAIALVSFIGNLFSLLSKSGTDMISVSAVPPEFSEYLIIFSYAMISLITLFSSLITSQLKNEPTYDAIKYLPIYMGIALILYWQFSKLLLMFFGNIF